MPRQLTRREFFKLSAIAAGSAVVAGGVQSRQGWRRVAASDGGTLYTSLNDVIVPGVCLLCPSGCGILTRVADGHVVKLEGNPMHPINEGALCPKGQAAPELLYNPDRLGEPLRRVGERGSGEWEPISWDEAITQVAESLNGLRSSGHPERAVLLHGEARGQLEPFFKRFMGAFGSPNVVSKESLNVAAAKLAMYLTQGVYDLPAYDIENAHYILSFGASLLEAGPFVQRMVSGISYIRQGRAERGKVVVIDPRQGVNGAKADEWIPINPGTDGALALGMAHVIIRSGLIDPDFIQNYSFGFEDFPDETGTRLIKGFKSFVLEEYPPDKVAEITGVASTTIARLAGEFAGNTPSIAILPGKGGLLNGTMGGVYAAMAVHMLNALVGSIETPGGILTQRYPSFHDWPAMAGDPVAETGCKAERIDGSGSQFPLGFNAYQAVADRILSGYPVEVLFLYDSNPVFETPGGSKFIDAFDKVPLVVSFSSFLDESAAYADLVLPEPTFLERYEDHYFEGLGYPGVGLRQPVIQRRHNTLPVGDFFLRVAAQMGGPVSDAFPWRTYESLLRYRLRPTLDAAGETAEAGWETIKNLGVWITPGYRFARRGSQKWVNEIVGRDRRYSPRDGYFDFYSRELFCLIGAKSGDELAALGLNSTDDVSLPHYLPTAYRGDEHEYPFTLNVVTIMALGPVSVAANMPSLQEISGMTVGETWGSWLEMNPETAHEHGLHDEDEVWVESLFGRVRTKLRTVKGLHPEVVNLPFNQGHRGIGRWADMRGVNGLELLDPASEPVSGLAAFTNTRVRVYPATEA